MDWEIIWATTALDAVEDAVRFNRQFSEEAAESLRSALFASVEILASFPEIVAVYEANESRHTREIL